MGSCQTKSKIAPDNDTDIKGILHTAGYNVIN